MKKKKLCFVFGTRPEIIKLSPLIKLCKKKKIPIILIHTGQHYSYLMDRLFIKELKLPECKYRLKVRSKGPNRQGDHTGRMLIKIEEILLKERPYCVVSQGDTNSALAGILTAQKISTTKSYAGYDIKSVHLEAGLRSYDRSMPEEINRFITDHLSDYCFAPTSVEKQIMIKEGVPTSKIFVVGNTIVDAVMDSLEIANKKSRVLNKLKLKKNKYILLTLHRQENVDSKGVFTNLIRGIGLVAKKHNLPIIFPVHPRTKKMIEKFKIDVPISIRQVKPIGYFDFLMLQAHAALIMTDSGGIQEEACILRVPCITLRENTERPQTIKVKSNMVAGSNPKRILSCSTTMLKRKRQWRNPFGDGKTSEKVLKVIMKS